MDIPFFESNTFAWVVLPLFIFCARVVDVSLGTLRIVFLSRGRRLLAPAFGFVEVLIWIIAIGQLVRNISNLTGYVAYAAGFAVGNFVGLYIEDKLAMGLLVIRIITNRCADQLVDQLHVAGYGVTSVDAHGALGDVKLVYTIIRRRDMQEVVGIVKSVNPKAFFSIEEIRSAREGIFPPDKSHYRKNPLSLLGLKRKAK
jgi:uncharacterized protein YebE (UPF0316 family)